MRSGSAKEAEANAPLISVIIPVYNTRDFLDRCVDSVLAQTYRRLEIILVDDGATDGSGERCDEYAALDERVRVVHRENGGLMRAWMSGAETAQGAYLSFVDSDDWIAPGMTEALADALSPDAARQVICCNYLVDKGDGTAGRPVAHALSPGVYTGDALRDQVFCHILGNEARTIGLSRCMKLFSEQLIRENLHFCNPEIRFGEDVNIVLPTLLSAERIVILRDHFDYHYFFRPSSMAHAYDRRLTENIRLLSDAIRRVMQEKAADAGIDPVRASELVEGEIFFLSLYIIKNELRSGGEEGIDRAADTCRKLHLTAYAREHRQALSGKEPINRLILWYVNSPTVRKARIIRLLYRFYDIRNA